MNYDVFISHASEDKEQIALPLAKILTRLGLQVWIDEFELKVGDSLRRSIDRGLTETRFGVVILSPNFLAKQWPQFELDALVAREQGQEAKIIIPVWHNITAKEVLNFSPALADRVAISSDNGIEYVAAKIAEAVILKTQTESQKLESRLASELEGRIKSVDSGWSGTREKQHTPSNIFIVHGHDEGARESVSRFVEKIGAKPIILQEQANAGRTIIEKFEDHSNVTFAIVLLTPDDIGYAVSDKSNRNFRARQNVIFELGYFLGKLGRRRFCIMIKGEPEIPSDMHGITYIRIDAANGWQISLAKELKQAGIVIDLNKLLD